MSHLSNFKTALKKQGFDAAIVSENLNQRYLSNFSFHDGLILVTLKESYLITDFRYEEAARAQASRELTVVTPTGGQLLLVAGLLADNGASRVAVEESALSLGQFNRYTDLLRDFTLTAGASALLEKLRLCKDEEELNTIERAQKITDAAFAHILSTIHPEMTEVDVALEL